MDLYDVAVARKLSSGGGGGGGSSDFSTAEVQIQSISSERLVGAVANYNPRDGYSSAGDFYVDTTSKTFNIILYKGKAVLYRDTIGGSVQTTGDVEYDAGNNKFIITGDGTITIS